ncbi:MAG: VWA domain-containing protein [Bacteroidales bacterium]|nr:VWA domain-containing protein [Bacteroidales bacterium]
MLKKHHQRITFKVKTKIILVFAFLLLHASCVIVDCVEENYSEEARERRRLGLNTPEDELLTLDYASTLLQNEPWKCFLAKDKFIIEKDIKSKADFLSFLKSKYYDFPLYKYSILKGETQPIIPVNNNFQLTVLDTLTQSQGADRVILGRVTDQSGNVVKGLTIKDFNGTSDQIEIKTVTEIDTISNKIIDLVFIVDQSISMNTTIHALRENIQNFVSGLSGSNFDWRINLVVYGDDVSTIGSYGTDIEKFKFDLPKITNLQGGYEVTKEALYAAVMKLQFRHDAKKIFVLCTDEYGVQDYGKVSTCELIKVLLNNSVSVFQVLNPEQNNSGFLSDITFGKVYDIQQEFVQILRDIEQQLMHGYRISFHEISFKKQLYINEVVAEGHIDFTDMALKFPDLDPFPLGYYKPFIRENEDDFMSWIEANPTFADIEESLRTTNDNTTKQTIGLLITKVADKLLILADSVNDYPGLNLNISLTGFTDSLQIISAIRYVDEPVNFEAIKIINSYSSNKELAYLRAFHSWKNLFEQIRARDSEGIFNKLINQKRIIIQKEFAPPDGVNRDRSLIKKRTDLRFFRKVVIEYSIVKQ